MVCSTLMALAILPGCKRVDPVQPPTEVPRIALITAIQYPQAVTVNDDVTVRFTVVINPCEDFAYAQDRPDGDAMRFTAFSITTVCVSAVPAAKEVEFFLQSPQQLPRRLIFDEPDGIDSVRVVGAKSGA
jgi:hypothetical protein